MDNKIKIKNQDGNVVEANVILYFNLNSTGNDYIVYDFNETDENDMVITYTSRYINDNGEITLEDINDENEWLEIKEAMRNIIKESGV